MGVTISDENYFDDTIKILQELSRTEEQVGIFGENDSELVKIAGAHEFGCVIRPKNAKRLAVPLNTQAKGKSPREFNDLFTINAKGKLYLVRKKADKLEFMYWLAKEVKIPERSFIRKGFDENKDLFVKSATGLLDKVIARKLQPEDFFELVGAQMAGKIQKYLKDLKEPGNSPLTVKLKGSGNPLTETGRLRDAITYKTVKNNA